MSTRDHGGEHSTDTDEGVDSRELYDRAISIVEHHTEDGSRYARTSVTQILFHATGAKASKLDHAIDTARREGELVQISGRLGMPTAETFRRAMSDPTPETVGEWILQEVESDEPFDELRPRVLGALNTLQSELRDEQADADA